MNAAERQAAAQLRERFDDSRQRDELAGQTYTALKATKRLKDHRLITYRCPRGCLLLDVVQVPGQMIGHSPAYKLSPGRNTETSTPAGREAHTRDGDRRWQARTYDIASALNFALQCDHVVGPVLDRDGVQADLDAGHAHVTVDASGSRKAR